MLKGHRHKKLPGDESFIRWLTTFPAKINKRGQKNVQWDTLSESDITHMQGLINNLKVKEKELPAKSMDELWEKIDTAMRPATVLRRHPSKRYADTTRSITPAPLEALRRHPSKRYVAGKRRRLSAVLRYAAVLCLLMAIPLYWLMKGGADSNPAYEALISKNLPGNDTGENILLTFGDNNKIEVKENNAEMIYDAGGKISILSKTEDMEVHTEEQNLNCLYVPYGKMTSLVLSDGTKIWVNSGSRLVYPSSFKGNKREIFVEGEVYLEVARDEKNPFIVKTDLLDVRVLGTSFNLSAYKNDDVCSVVLVSGSVSVGEAEKRQKTIIHPRQKYTYDKDMGNYDVKEVDASDYICWKEGFLYFRNELLGNVFKKLQRYYNVSMEYDHALADGITISGKLDLKENMRETFRIISFTAPLDYTIMENKIIIGVKP